MLLLLQLLHFCFVVSYRPFVKPKRIISITISFALRIWSFVYSRLFYVYTFLVENQTPIFYYASRKQIVNRICFAVSFSLTPHSFNSPYIFFFFVFTSFEAVSDLCAMKIVEYVDINKRGINT